MKKAFYNWREKLWVTPAFFSLLAILLSIAMFYVDLLLVERFREYIPGIVLTNVELAKTIMGELAGALLTMTTFTFSTILVVLTMYSSQFSPRTLKNFIHDPVTWRVLGIFLGGFIYNTLSLLFMRDDLYETDVLAAFVGIVIAFICLATFAYFIHHIATHVQVGKLLNELEADAERVISDYSEKQKNDMELSEGWVPGGMVKTLKAQQDGYIQFLHFDEIVDCAKQQEFEIEILQRIGTYVHEETELFRVYVKEERDLDIHRFVTIGQERTSSQDVDFAVQKMVEVALRAISPGINDPNTANGIILRIGRLLGKMSHLKTGAIVMADDRGQARVKYHFFSYEDLLYRTFHQLAHYGKEDVSVVGSMFEALTIALETSGQHDREAIWASHLYVLDRLDGQSLSGMDRQFVQGKLDALARAADRRPLLLSQQKYQ